MKLKIPTSFKKKLWKEIDRLNPSESCSRHVQIPLILEKTIQAVEIHRWRKDLQQIHKSFKNQKLTIYREMYLRKNRDIEVLKASGDLAMALRLEAKNPGQMARNLIQYLRYSAGDTMATKVKPGASTVKMHDLMLKKEVLREPA